MRLAVLISGRAARYEACLLPILKSSPHTIDLFMSINDNDDEYYELMRTELAQWLKGVYIKPYELPEGFETTYNGEFWKDFQEVNGKFVPLFLMSRFYNDNKAFKMATEYADSNKVDYDFYVRFRSDIFNIQLDDFGTPSDELRIYSAPAPCHFLCFSKHRVPAISCDVFWGNRKSMAVICNTYEYVLSQNKENIDYIIHAESCIVDNLIDSGVPYAVIPKSITYDRNRKIFDTIKDTRPPLKESLPSVNKKDINFIRSIPASEQLYY